MVETKKIIASHWAATVAGFRIGAITLLSLVSLLALSDEARGALRTFEASFDCLAGVAFIVLFGKFRKTLPASLSLLSFTFRTALFWLFSSSVLLLGQFGYLESSQDLATIGAEVTRVIFFTLAIFSVLRETRARGKKIAIWTWAPVVLIPFTFLVGILSVASSSSLSLGLIGLFSLLDLFSGILSVWIISVSKI